MKVKISKRDIKFFILGFLTLFIIELIWSWDDNVEDFKRGWRAAGGTSTESTK